MGNAMSGLKKFVFCEGKDDMAVVARLADYLRLDIVVKEYQGRNNLANALRTFALSPEFAQQQVAAIAILRDADANADAAFASVRDALGQNSFEAPATNCVFTSTTPRIGVFIIGVDGKGMLESLLLKSVEERPEFSCLDAYFACVARYSLRDEFHPKARFRVWMASQDDYKDDAGKAAEKGYWPWESPAFDSLKKFLLAL
jgi:hypothetical protein